MPIFIWFFLLSLAGSLLLFPYLLSFLKATGGRAKNFRGKSLPTTSGILIVMVVLLSLGATALFFKDWLKDFKNILSPLVTLIVGIGFLGLLDDLLGRRSASGFGGHFRRLKEGYLTSGVLKALGGAALSLYIASLFSPNLALLLLNALVLAFFINLLNLLDLRPGRSLKVFLLLGLVTFLFSTSGPTWILWGLFLPPVFFLLYTDLKESCMIGDVGSNILGAILGFTFVINFGWVPKLIILLLLLGIQIYAERYSLTTFIKRVSFLRWLDELGRMPD